jgi:hypothetical protein
MQHDLQRFARRPPPGQLALVRAGVRAHRQLDAMASQTGQNLHRGRPELAADEPAQLRAAVAFDELATAA